MKREHQISYEILHEKLTIQDIINSYDAPLKIFKDDLPNYPILDIGVGLGEASSYFASERKKVISIDDDDLIISKFQAKIDSYNKESKDKLDITILKQVFPNLSLPINEFSCIILSQILHFFDYDVVRQSINSLDKYLMKNGMVFIKVHSVNHPSYSETKKVTHFNHFFTKEEVKELIIPLNYKVMYLSEYWRTSSNAEIEHKREWYKRIQVEFHHVDLNNPKLKEYLDKNAVEEPHACITLIAKKI